MALILKKNYYFNKIFLYNSFFFAIIVLAFFRGLGKAPTFLVPIINPPFADNSPRFIEKQKDASELLKTLTPTLQLMGSPSGYPFMTSAGTSKTLPHPPKRMTTWGLPSPRFLPFSIR